MGSRADQPRWNEALYGGNDTLLRSLVQQEPRHISLVQLNGFINGLYQRARLRPWMPANARLREQVDRVTPRIAEIRSSLSMKEQQGIDLGFLRHVRDSGRLSVVIGAGASKAAGAPLWVELVEQLLEMVTARGLPAAAEREAGRILGKIKSGRADSEDLMAGAQLCVDEHGQHLFTHMHRYLYGGAPRPGPVYDAIAEVAEPPQGRPGPPFGWSTIVNYNFDNLVGEAIDARDLPRISYLMWDKKIKCASQRVRSEAVPHIPVLHLHGYTPRRLFPITKIPFVFSTKQYATVYGGPRVGVMKRAFEECLARPIDIALYVGCSFNDEYMNELLREAADGLPGRRHYALLEWRHGDCLSATANDRARREAPYHRFGIQPIWFRTVREVPGLVRSLAGGAIAGSGR